MQRRRKHLGIVVAVGIAAAVAAVGGVMTTQGKNSPDLSGDANANEIHGDARANTLNGMGGNDTITGNGGNDTLRGNEGRDKVYGNDGADVVEGGPDDDLEVFGNEGADKVYGGAGDDASVGGGPGGDKVFGEAGNDYVDGGEDIDVVDGGPGNDEVHGGGGNDEVLGGDGNDQVYGDGGKDNLFGGAGNDGLHMVGSNGTANGGDGDDWLVVRDALTGTFANGGAGNDIVFAEQVAGADPVITVDCGPGSDTAYVTANDSVANCEVVNRTGVAQPEAKGSAPVINAVNVPSAVSYTNVAVSISASDPDNDIREMRLTNYWVPFGAYVPFDASTSIALTGPLGAGGGVMVQLRDSKGNESTPALAPITRTAAPVILSVTAPSTTETTSVAVHVNATDADSAVDKIRVAAGGAAWSDWKAYGPDLSVTLPSSLGAKTIYVQVRDANGGDSNIGSVVVNRVAASTTNPPGKGGGGSADTATSKDKVKPRIVSMKLPATTCTRSVTLKLHAMDNRKVVKMRVAVKGSKYGAWRAYKASSKVTLPKGTGGKAVRVQVRDAAGNVSAVSLRRTSLKSCSS